MAYKTNEFLNEINQQVGSIIEVINVGTSDISKENLLFCYKVVIKAINACLERRYSDFDALTTSNCCHGMAIFVHERIFSLMQSDIKLLLKKIENKRELLEEKNLLSIFYIPKSLIDLAHLYMLCFIAEKNFFKGLQTVKTKLKLISPLGTKLCNRIVNGLQKIYSNIIALNYHKYSQNIKRMKINGLSLDAWGKYVHPHYLRVDQFGVHYASNLFSMQVSLAHLIRSKAKVAIVSDFIGPNGVYRERYVQLFQGDGEAHFVPLDSLEVQNLHQKRNEPLIVLGGCLYSKDMNLESFHEKISVWIHQLPSLVLACDVVYPQFPKVSNDPKFDSSPIEPEEDQLQNIITKYAKIEGVSALDPSLFCLAHIYPASICQVLKVSSNENRSALPFSWIPLNKLSEKIRDEFQL